MKAIETAYNGYKFRSRLEARWAVCFDALKIKWNYEPEGFDLGGGMWYLPDFYLPEWDTWIEIKPTIPNLQDDCIVKQISFTMQNKGLYYMICGSPGVPKLKIKKDKWSLEDGYLAINSVLFKDGILFTLNAFAMAQGGKRLDLWPIYANGKPTEAGMIFKSPILPNGFIQRAYMGDGVRFDHKKLVNAYAKARQARFEHGKRGN